MNLHHLSVFHAVSQTHSLTAAGEKLLIGQPAVSAQLKLLERSLGTTLVERLPRGVRLTEAGTVLADYAARIFKLADDATAAVKDLDGLRRGRLIVGASPTIGVYFLPPLLVHFTRRFPGLDLQMEIEESTVLQQRLNDGLLDLALTPTAPDSPLLDSAKFMDDQFVAVAAPDHALSKHRRVSPETLASSFIARALPSRTGSLVASYFTRLGISARPRLSLASIEAVKQAVIAALGVTIISKLAASPELANNRLVALKVPGLPLVTPVFAVRLRNRPPSKAAIAFGCLLRHAVRGTLPKKIRET